MDIRTYGRSRYVTTCHFTLIYIINLKNWVHVDIDDPIEASSPTGPNNSPEPNPEQIAMLADIGFTSAQARKALRETVRELSWSSMTFLFFL